MAPGEGRLVAGGRAYVVVDMGDDGEIADS